MLKTQADPRGCIYKKAHTTPDTSLDNAMLFFVTFITGICLTSPDLTSVQRTRGGHISWKEGNTKNSFPSGPSPQRAVAGDGSRPLRGPWWDWSGLSLAVAYAHAQGNTGMSSRLPPFPCSAPHGLAGRVGILCWFWITLTPSLTSTSLRPSPN